MARFFSIMKTKNTGASATPPASTNVDLSELYDIASSAYLLYLGLRGASPGSTQDYSACESAARQLYERLSYLPDSILQEFTKVAAA